MVFSIVSIDTIYSIVNPKALTSNINRCVQLFVKQVGQSNRLIKLTLCINVFLDKIEKDILNNYLVLNEMS